MTTIMILLLLLLFAFSTVFAPLPNSPKHQVVVNAPKFGIENDMFWKDGQPFRIIGGDLHYFRTLPEYWEDRLLRAKALGLNAVQTYVPWNLHEPKEGQLEFHGIADIVSFLELCHKLDLLVMLRPGPYICAEWDFGGFPAWLLTKEPAITLRSSDPRYLALVDSWWGVLLPKIAHLLYHKGGPIIMVQIENEFGSYGDDKDYLHHLINLARSYLGDDIILYTTDGGTRDTLTKGTIRGDTVFSAVDFSTGEDPWPIFKMQKAFNAPGKSPPLSAEFYTGWLTHWGESIAKTDAASTASALENILSRNGSAVLYMVHGGTNFGFYNGANAAQESDYDADLTSYDYDAPISESGDVDGAKFKALRGVIAKYSATSLPPVPLNNKKTGYGRIQLEKTSSLFNTLDLSTKAIESENPISMEAAGQMFGFLLYVSEYTTKGKRSTLSIPKVHDRAQVYVTCLSEDKREKAQYVGTINRWSNTHVNLPNAECSSTTRLLILVENMGRINYGPYLFDSKGILSAVYLDGKPLLKWKMIPIPLSNLNENNLSFNNSVSKLIGISARKSSPGVSLKEPAFYSGNFVVDKVTDTYMSFNGWGKGVAFVNNFNIGRFWPSFGAQCNLYVPAPVLQRGNNVLVILELESPEPELMVNSVDRSDFTCDSNHLKVREL
ncbi:putative beta-galactosidase [Helianthus annuus]|uniref:Beta-galactosidase n=1 Tax=Helianthus annuus TaxID=4232 RepID=A0A251UPL4_HELAN|nr:beta-galactosidase 17 [Helianthus annuus]KAF5805359.1 putative beta-galactosidase [Helianthus annuus]KAJ0569810.1 putative beta-galactosidase [Helianthus annuus]KAJ0584133.1 putative beta-galactosidase [Helianthus annuus]KAJ0749799.1 putative beta-galactosidase [Helianthus annuus]KAJ0918428.1 putative beta-galactosidase [Helianthus annuus]